MKDIIRGAQDKRYKVAEGDDNKESIQITEAWVEELKKHPYSSRNLFRLTLFRQTWQGTISFERERESPQGTQGKGASSPDQEADIRDHPT